MQLLWTIKGDKASNKLIEYFEDFEVFLGILGGRYLGIF